MRKCVSYLDVGLSTHRLLRTHILPTCGLCSFAHRCLDDGSDGAVPIVERDFSARSPSRERQLREKVLVRRSAGGVRADLVCDRVKSEVRLVYYVVQLNSCRIAGTQREGAQGSNEVRSWAHTSVLLRTAMAELQVEALPLLAAVARLVVAVQGMVMISARILLAKLLLDLHCAEGAVKSTFAMCAGCEEGAVLVAVVACEEGAVGEEGEKDEAGEAGEACVAGEGRERLLLRAAGCSGDAWAEAAGAVTAATVVEDFVVTLVAAATAVAWAITATEAAVVMVTAAEAVAVAATAWAVVAEEDAVTVAARVLVVAAAMAEAEVVVAVAEVVAAEVASAEAAAAAATAARSAVVAAKAAVQAAVRRARRPTTGGSLLARPRCRRHSARDGCERKRNPARCHRGVREA